MPADAISAITLRPLGVIRSPFRSVVGMPIQTVGAPHERASLQVFEEFAQGLRDIEGFEYLILLTHLHEVEKEKLQVVPFMDDTPRGVFATRAPARPNRIGLSIVRLLSVDGTTLHFEGNDMLDGTPVIDIKPYVPQLDVRETARIGWFEKRVQKVAQTRSDDRMR